MTFNHEELGFILEAIRLKIRYTRQNSWPPVGSREREDILKKYEVLERTISHTLEEPI